MISRHNNYFESLLDVFYFSSVKGPSSLASEEGAKFDVKLRLQDLYREHQKNARLYYSNVINYLGTQLGEFLDNNLSTTGTGTRRCQYAL